MKTKLILMISICLSSFLAKAQTGLHIQEYSINYMYVYNPDSVYIALSIPSSPFKRMVLLNPNTKEWKYINSIDYTGYIGPFVMKSPTEGVMVSYSQNKVYKTTDGWVTRTEIPNVANGWGVQDVVVTDAGYAGYETTLGDLYFSPDGVTWTLAFDGSSTAGYMEAYGNKVVVYGTSLSDYISTDGGQSYNMVNTNLSTTGNFLEFEMLSEDTFIIATTQNLYTTTDGGSTWSAPLPLPNGNTNGMAIKDFDEIFITSQLGGPFYTADGGANWQTTNPLPGATGAMNYIGNKLFYNLADVSTDNGTTWTYLLPSNQGYGDITDIDFVGSYGVATRYDGRMQFSADKGRSFDRAITLPTSEDLFAVKLLGNNHIVAGDRKGQIYYSTDGGANWVQKNTNGTNLIARKFSVSADENIIVCTRQGQPLISSNHGSTFDVVSVGGGNHSQTVKPSGQIIDVVGWFDYTTFQDKGWEISSVATNGAKTVLDTFLAAGETLVDVFMVNDNIGYLVVTETASKNTKIYKTTNGWGSGTTAVGSIPPVVPGFANYQQHALNYHFFGPDTIILQNDLKTYWHYSYNGGQTWTQASLPENIHSLYPSSYASLKGSFFFNASEYIMHLNTSSNFYLNINSSTSIPIAIEEPIEAKTNMDALVYPNPSNNRIFVKVDAQWLDMEVYDYTGKLVRQNSRKTVAEGLDISNLSPGMYVLVGKDDKGQSINTRFVKN